MLVRQTIGKIYPNQEIHTEVYILIDLSSADFLFRTCMSKIKNAGILPLYLT